MNPNQMRPMIIATGSAAADTCVTNDMLAEHMDTNDEWIRTRTGIRTRYIAKAGGAHAEINAGTNGKAPQTGGGKLFRLASTASERAVTAAEAKGLLREEIGLVIAATSTADEIFPALSCRLQDVLKLPRAAGMDVSLACTGFIAALQTADAYIRAGMYANVLVVGADVMSRMLDWTDRGTAILFGDAAGAVVLSGDRRFAEKTAETSPEALRTADAVNGTAPQNDAAAESFRGIPRGILASRLHSFGDGAAALSCGGMYFNEAEPQPIQMDGRRVFDFAVRKVPAVIREVLEAAEPYLKYTAARRSAQNKGALTEPADEAVMPKYYILHQANYRIIESVAKKLKAPIERFPHNIERYANTTAATIPLLLDELNRAGKLQAGDLLCLAGFGAGLSTGAVLLRW